MSFVPLEKLLPRARNSIYLLVALASKRAMELADGLPRLIENPSSPKTATIALEEIAAGKVILKPLGKESSAKAESKAQESESEEKVESVSV